MTSGTQTIDKLMRRLNRISENAILSLKACQIYQPPELVTAEHILGSQTPLFDHTTPIGSMGSCFAREIKTYLETNGYNYVHYGEGKRASFGSAAWERVFNTACIRQEVDRVLNETRAQYITGKDGRIYDLRRKGTHFGSLKEARDEETEYMRCAARALMDSDVFIFTCGLSEVWYDNLDGVVLAEAPPIAAYDSTRHAFRLLTPDENVCNLRSALELLLARKPSAHVILTVSPVPLRATFFDRSATISNNISKATLLYTAHVLSQELPHVHYFPSYEITQYLTKNPFGWDGRHVTEETVSLIMSLFIRTFGK